MGRILALIAAGAVIATAAGAVARIYDDDRLQDRVDRVEVRLREDQLDRARSTCAGQTASRRFLADYFAGEARRNRRLAAALRANGLTGVATTLEEDAGDSANAARRFRQPPPCLKTYPDLRVQFP